MDVFDLAASLTLNTNNYMNGLSSAGSAISSFGSKLSSGLQTAAKVSTAAVGAAATGIASLTTAAVNSYAEYEQLVGGVDTLFKDSSQKVQEYAANAYKTAGMSANDYMANATAFSASLISSLGGDTAAAAEYANRAMVSMSDNANKMGTNMDSIVQTYQSLSRGNYAMLDNLKLGYGGTKAELQRLIADAATYTDVQKEMGITVDASSMSFDNIVNAIAVVQGHLGIAGATALEAGTTIEGSVNSMKAAWANLVTGIADDNANMEDLINKFVTTIVGDGTDKNLGVFGNLMPTIHHALTGAANLINGLLPKIMQEIPKLINDNLHILAEAAVGIVKSLLDGISSNQEAIFNTVLDVVMYLVDSFIGFLPQFVEIGLNLIVSIANGIANNLSKIIDTSISVISQIIDVLTNPEFLSGLAEAGMSIISTLAGYIMDELPAIIETASNILQKIIDTVVTNAPRLIESARVIITTLVDNILDFIPELIPVAVNIILTIVDGMINRLDKMLDAAVQVISALAEGIINALPILMEKVPILVRKFVNTIIEHAPQLIESAKEIINYLANGILDFIPELIPVAVSTIITIVENLIGNVDKLIDSAIAIIMALAEGLINSLPILIEKAPVIIQKLVDAIVNNAPKLLDAAFTLITTLAKALIDYLPDLLASIPTIISSLVDGLIEVAPKLLESAFEFIKTIGEGLVEYLPQLAAKAPVIITELVLALIENVGKLFKAAGEIVESLKDGIVDNFPKLLDRIPQLMIDIVNNFVDAIGDGPENIGNMIVDGLWGGIRDGWDWLIDSVDGLVDSLVDGVKDVLGIHSPSRVFAQIGEYCADGLDEGISSAYGVFDNVYDTISESMKSSSDKLSSDASRSGFDAVGEGIASMLINGTSSSTNKHMVSDIMDAIRVVAEELVEKSPRLFKPVGEALYEGILSGISKKIDVTMRKDILSYIEIAVSENSFHQKLAKNFNDAGLSIYYGMISGFGDGVSGRGRSNDGLIKDMLFYIDFYATENLVFKFYPKLAKNFNDAGVAIYDGMMSGFGDGVSGKGRSNNGLIKDMLSTIDFYATNNDVYGFYEKIAKKFRNVGVAMSEGILEGFSSKYERLSKDITKMISWIVNDVKDMLGIHSPSRVFSEIGEFCVAGFNEGLEGLVDTSALKKSISSSVDEISSSVKSVNANSNSNGVQYNQTINVNQKISTPDELARAIKLESRYGLMRGVSLG